MAAGDLSMRDQEGLSTAPWWESPVPAGWDLGAETEEARPVQETAPADRAGQAPAPLALPSLEEAWCSFEGQMKGQVTGGSASRETLRAYLNDVRQHLAWLEERGTALGEVEEGDLEAYREWLTRQYAGSSTARKLAALRRFYEMARTEGQVSHNPAARIRCPRQTPRQPQPVKHLAYKTVRQIVSTPVSVHRGGRVAQGARDCALMILMAVHSLRVAELHRLDLADVDLGAEEHGTLQVKGKRGRARTISLTPESHAVVELWLGARRLLHGPTEAVFVTLNWNRAVARAGGRMSQRAIREIVERYLRLCKVKGEGITCHSLRHTYSTMELSLDLLRMTEAVREADLTSPEDYVALLDRARQNPANLLAGLLLEEEPEPSLQAQRASPRALSQLVPQARTVAGMAPAE